MSEKNGVCTIIPRGQDDFRPEVFGMGILVSTREVITCAHVINAALGPKWQQSSPPVIVKVCFPFTEGHTCVEGCVDRKRWFPPGRSKSGDPSDIAVIQLAKDAPACVDRVFLQDHVVGANAKAYGFRGKMDKDGRWRSHPSGEWAEGKVVGPQPGGRVQFDGLRTTGARVEKGYSGGAVYDTEQNAVVGMIVESDRDDENKIAQFIDAPALRKAHGTKVVWSSNTRRLLVGGVMGIAILTVILKLMSATGPNCDLAATVTRQPPNATAKPLFLLLTAGDREHRYPMEKGNPVAIQVSRAHLSKYSITVFWSDNSWSDFGEFSGCTALEKKESRNGGAIIDLVVR